MIHQNEYFSPGTPLRPLLRAVYTHCPDYDIRGVDVVTDRSSLLKLFKFVRGEVKPPPTTTTTTHTHYTPRGGGGEGGGYRGRGGLPTPPGSPSRGRGAGLGYRGGGGWGGFRREGGGRQMRNMDPPKEGRIDVDIMGGSGGTRPSMLLSRWETQSSEVVPEGQFMGWGYQFLNRFTRFGDAGEEAVMDEGELQSHHRVVEYEMGGMRFLVRYHGDAITQSLAEFRFWAEKERAAMRRRERAKGREQSKAEAAAVREKREKAVREKELKGEGEPEPEPARRKSASPQSKADDWLEKEFIEGLSKLTLNRVKTTGKSLVV